MSQLGPVFTRSSWCPALAGRGKCVSRDEQEGVDVERASVARPEAIPAHDPDGPLILNHLVFLLVGLPEVLAKPVGGRVVAALGVRDAIGAAPAATTEPQQPVWQTCISAGLHRIVAAHLAHHGDELGPAHAGVRLTFGEEVLREALGESLGDFAGGRNQVHAELLVGASRDSCPVLPNLRYCRHSFTCP